MGVSEDFYIYDPCQFYCTGCDACLPDVCEHEDKQDHVIERKRYYHAKTKGRAKERRKLYGNVRYKVPPGVMLYNR